MLEFVIEDSLDQRQQLEDCPEITFDRVMSSSPMAFPVEVKLRIINRIEADANNLHFLLRQTHR